MSVDFRVGDTRDVIKSVPDGSVDFLCSSPPFLALRSYVPADHESKHREIGSEANPAAFIDMLLGLTAEWGRVLAAHGSIAIELGDTYSGSGGAGGDYNEGGWRDGQGRVDGSASRITQNAPRYSAATGNIADARGGTAVVQMRNNGGTYWPSAKSLALVPQLYAIALAYGINPLTGQASPAGRWLVRNVIVWHRPNPAVGALGDKVRPSTSYIVIATRSAKRWFDLTAVRGPVSATTPQSPSPKALRMEVLGEHGKGMPSAGTYHANGGAPPLDAWFDEYDGSHDTWTLTTQPSRLAHYAMWPAKLAERLVLMMCPAQVCRVCGEPRRRMEGAAEYVGVTGETRADLGGRSWHDRHDNPFEIGRTQRATGRDLNVTRSALTLGWTDCGCVCDSCDSARWTDPDPAYTETPQCPDCTDGRPFRPGHVLDPFAGSGTTLAVADLHGRNATGIDFDQRNHDLYPSRYDEVKRALFGTIPELPGQQDLFSEVGA